MRRFAMVLAVLLWATRAGVAQEAVRFPSLADGPGMPAAAVDGYLYRAPGPGPHPAIVGLHGCSGLFNPRNGLIFAIYRAWATVLNQRGYSVLLVDSFRPRGHGEMCSIEGF